MLPYIFTSECTVKLCFQLVFCRVRDQLLTPGRHSLHLTTPMGICLSMSRRKINDRPSHEPDAPLPITLPDELITEVLSFLDVKSLMRFKCLSKSWNSLTSDPFFVELHLNKIFTKLTHRTALARY